MQEHQALPAQQQQQQQPSPAALPDVLSPAASSLDFSVSPTSGSSETRHTDGPLSSPDSQEAGDDPPKVRWTADDAAVRRGLWPGSACQDYCVRVCSRVRLEACRHRYKHNYRYRNGYRYRYRYS